MAKLSAQNPQTTRLPLDSSRAFARRNITHLSSVGALLPAGQRVVHRVQQLTDGKVSDELRLDQLQQVMGARYTRAMGSDEKQSLHELVGHLELPDVPAPAPALVLEPLEVFPLLCGPSPFDEKPFSIARLPEALRAIAARVQNVEDTDGNAATIQLKDVNAACADLIAFTPDEQRELQLLKRELRFKTARACKGTRLSAESPTTLRATLHVPMPGVARIPLAHAGDLPIALETTTCIRESRTKREGPKSGAVSGEVQILLTRRKAIFVEVPAHHQVILIPRGGGSEHLLSETAAVSLQEGRWRVELWHSPGAGKKAERIQSSEIELACMKAEILDISAYAGFAFCADNVELCPTVVQGISERTADECRRDRTDLKAAWEYGAEPPTSEQERTYAVEGVPSALRPGRYLVEAQDHLHLLDVYPSGAMSMQRDDGPELWFTPSFGTQERRAEDPRVGVQASTYWGSVFDYFPAEGGSYTIYDPGRVG